MLLTEDVVRAVVGCVLGLVGWSPTSTWAVACPCSDGGGDARNGPWGGRTGRLGNCRRWQRPCRRRPAHDAACARGATLVTGTPPYFDVTKDEAGGATTNFGAFPACEQSAGARYEFRGGIEAYCKAAVDVMAPTGTFVVCEGGLHVNLRRVQKAAEAAGLVVVGHRPVVGRAGKPTLFGVWTMRPTMLVGRRDDYPRLASATGPAAARRNTALCSRHGDGVKSGGAAVRPPCPNIKDPTGRL